MSARSLTSAISVLLFVALYVVAVNVLLYTPPGYISVSPFAERLLLALCFGVVLALLGVFFILLVVVVVGTVVSSLVTVMSAVVELFAEGRARYQVRVGLRNHDRAVLLEDVDRLLVSVTGERLAEALGVRRSVGRAALIGQAARLGRDAAYTIAVANREVA